MSQKSNKWSVFSVALFFSFLAFLFLPHYAHISEADDVFVAGATVIPTLIVSIVLCFILIQNRWWLLSIIVTLFNSFNALLAIAITYEAILEVLSLSIKIYDGKVEYTSFDIFIVGIIPAVLVSINWLVIFFKLVTKKNA